MPTQPAFSDSSLSTTHTSTRPTAVAIAVPLAICALILLCALIFCARNRSFRKPGGKGIDLEGRDWQAVIKEKAAAAAMSGVVVTERKSEIPGSAVPIPGYRNVVDREHRYPQVRTDEAGRREMCSSELSSQSRTRCLAPIREGEYFTSIPSIDVGRRGYRNRDRDSHDSRRFYGRQNGGYYGTSRRSSSSLGGDEGCTCSHRERERGLGFERQSKYREERGYECTRDPSVEGSIYNPHPPRSLTTHLSSHSNYHSHSHSHGHEQSHEPTRYSRPLPEPMIRTSTRYTTESGTHEWAGGPAIGMGMGKCAPPHKSGVLDRESSSSSTDTDAGGLRYGRGRSNGRGRVGEQDEEMGELYESLRRAIGTRDNMSAVPSARCKHE